MPLINPVLLLHFLVPPEKLLQDMKKQLRQAEQLQARFFGCMCVAKELILSDLWILNYILDIGYELLIGCFFNEF
jgi:hypothetical protein